MKLFVAAIMLAAVAGVSAGLDEGTCGTQAFPAKYYRSEYYEGVCDKDNGRCRAKLDDEDFDFETYKIHGCCCDEKNDYADTHCAKMCAALEAHTNCVEESEGCKRCYHPRRPRRTPPCAPKAKEIDQEKIEEWFGDDCPGKQCGFKVFEFLTETTNDLDANPLSIGPNVKLCPGRKNATSMVIGGEDYKCLPLCCRCCYNFEWTIFTEWHSEDAQCLDIGGGDLNVSPKAVFNPQHHHSESNTYVCCRQYTDGEDVTELLIATVGRGAIFNDQDEFQVKSENFFGPEYRALGRLGLQCVPRQGGSFCESSCDSSSRGERRGKEY